VDLFQQCEWGGGAAKHAISNSGYRLNGQTLAAAGRAPVTTAPGYLYSGETFTPIGYKLNGTQIVLQKPGCRPRSAAQRGATLWGMTDAQVTRYINRFSDGEVWVSSAMNSRSGTQISWPTAGTAYPRGIRYLIVQLCGGGGAGGTGGLLATYNNQGGQGGACVVCIQLPENGYATVMAGGGGSGVGGFAADGNGGKPSYVQSAPTTRRPTAAAAGTAACPKQKARAEPGSTTRSIQALCGSLPGVTAPTGTPAANPWTTPTIALKGARMRRRRPGRAATAAVSATARARTAATDL